MKRLIIISSILLFILGLSIYSVFYTLKLYEQADALIASSIEACDSQNSELLNENSKKLSALWERKQLLLSIFIRHDDLENVDIAIVNVEAFSQVNEYSFARSELLNLQFMLEHLYKHVVPSLENIF